MNASDGQTFEQGTSCHTLTKKSRQAVSRRAFAKGLIIGGAACAVGISAVGCGGSSDTLGVHDGGKSSVHDGSEPPASLTILYNDAPNSFDPVNKWDGWYTVCRGLTETLVVFDTDMSLRPCLAVDWTNIDELTWQFTIREGVFFQSGRQMDPQAVKESLERSIERAPRAAKKVRIDSIDVDENTIVLHTTEPVSTLPGELAEPVFSIVDVEVVDTAPAHAGTGPYEGDDVSSTESFTLRAYKGYWGGTATVAALTCRRAADANTRAIALRSHDADISSSLLASDLKTFENDPTFTTLTSESVRSVFVICNLRNPLLADRVIREALSKVTDRETIGNLLLGGNIRPNGLPFPSYLSYSRAVSDVAQTFDLSSAATLLDSAGYLDTDGDGIREKDGQRLSFSLAYYSSRPEFLLLAPALQDAYRQIGIEITLQLYENVDTVYYNADFDLMLYNTTTVGNGDPSYFLTLYFASDGSENAGGYANDEVDALVEKMRGEFNQETRFELAAQATRLIMADCPNIFIGSSVMNAVCTSDVTGYSLYPVEYYGVTNKLW